MKLPIIIAIPGLLFILLVLATTGMTIYERNTIYENRFNQAQNEAQRLLTILQKVTEEKLAKAEDDGLINTYDVVITHDYLMEMQLIASDGYIMYANQYEKTGTNISADMLSYLHSIRSKDLVINDDKNQFSIVYPVRQLAGNFSNHVAYIYSSFDLKPIQRQVDIEIESRILNSIVYTFILMFLLFLVLLFTVIRPLKSLREAFTALSKHDYQHPISDSLWIEFSQLAKHGNDTRLILSEAAKEQAILAQILNVAEGLFILDDKFRLMRINAGFSQVFESEPSYLLNESAMLMGLITMEDRNHLVRNGSMDNEVTVVINNHSKTILNSASKVETEGEVYYVGVIKDITLQKEEALKREKARDEFVASVSHELRTPLNGIIGMTKLLMKDPLSEYQQDNINNILGSSDLLLSVINEILDFSKIEAGQLQLDFVPFNFRTAFSDIIAMFEHLSEEKSIQFNSFMSPEVPTYVKGDPVRLQQVLNNFCSNALKFTKKGSISITFQVVGEEGHKVSLQCLVVDTGIGISSDKQDQLFKAFKQEDSSTSRNYGGTGLGLYISKQLIDKMDGSIIFHSRKHVGSTFGFTVPLELLSEDDVLQDAQSVYEDVDISDVSILVVDDNHINVEVAKSLLLDHSEQVYTAYSGKEALEVCSKYNVDVVLMDIQMPVMDGIETFLELKKLDGYENTPVFALTANVMKQDVQKYHKYGFTEVVAKPFDIDELVRQIGKTKK